MVSKGYFGLSPVRAYGALESQDLPALSNCLHPFLQGETPTAAKASSLNSFGLNQHFFNHLTIKVCINI